VGTGKTTVVKYAIDECGLDETHVAFAAYTGRAALVLTKKNGFQASTIHRLIYKFVEADPDEVECLRGRYRELCDERPPRADMIAAAKMALDEARKPKWRLRLKDDAFWSRKLIVIDEASMVDGQISRDLMSFGIKIVSIGDPYQLPPITERSSPFLTTTPDAMLHEIHRQALDSPIIRLSIKARNGERIDFGDYGDGTRKVRNLSDPEMLAADQIITGKHIARHALNSDLKRVAGFSDRLPTGKGEKIIVTQNNYDAGVVNGEFINLENCSYDKETKILHVRIAGHPHTDGFEFYTGCLLEQEKHGSCRDRSLLEIDWGWVITVHKAQGSEWPHVVVNDDGWGYTPTDRARWLYTAITRASERLTIRGRW
jgi:exodeoxyribonuclease-5